MAREFPPADRAKDAEVGGSSPPSGSASSVGMDIGGTHVTAALLDMESGQIVRNSRVVFEVDSHGASEPILARWSEAARCALAAGRRSSIAGIGIAMPGPFDYPRGIAWIRGLGKYDSLYGLNIRARLKEELGLPAEFPVLFHNDALCFLLGESWQGAAKGFRDVMTLTLGTGLGSGFLRDGVCVNRGPGLPPSGWLYDVPFRDAMGNDYFSTKGLLRIWRARGGEEVPGVKEVAERAVSDERARAAFAEFGSLLGEFLAPIAREFAPQCIVIGGNIARAWDLFAPALQAEMKARAADVRTVPSRLLEDAALLGAARLPLLYKEPPPES